ncbi:hypothetical protein ACSSS7_004872 [Eimeria intestinalis]
METHRSQRPPSPKGPREASRPTGPSGPSEAPLSLSSLVKSTRAQSLRERWNTLKLQGSRASRPSEAQGGPLKTPRSSLQPGQTPAPGPVGGGPPSGPDSFVLRAALLERHRNEQLAAQKETLAAGVRRVSEEERQQLLSILLQQKEKAEKELSGLPIALKTERQRLRSDELERLLVSLEKQLLKLTSKDLFIEKGDSNTEETLSSAGSIPAR